MTEQKHDEPTMTKQQYLDLLMLLSALESWSFSVNSSLPDYLGERIGDAIGLLRAEILK